MNFVPFMLAGDDVWGVFCCVYLPTKEAAIVAMLRQKPQDDEWVETLRTSLSDIERAAKTMVERHGGVATGFVIFELAPSLIERYEALLAEQTPP